MKIFHFALIFVIFFLAVIIKTDISIGKMKMINNEKTELITSLNTATSDAIHYLAESGTHGTNLINKDEVIQTFFKSLYSAMGIASDTTAQEEVKIYIPVILLCDTDGYYVYYYDEYKDSEGYTYSSQVWSEKKPYFYSDNQLIYNFTLNNMVSVYDKNNILEIDKNFIETDYQEIQTSDEYSGFRSKYPDSFLLNNDLYELVKKEAIIGRLEEEMSYYTSRHNMIASHNGITYTFAFPSGNSNEWASYMDDLNLVVVFQGYPYGAILDYTFNKVVSVGANVTKKPAYYVEQKSWYYLAHIEGCKKLEEDISLLEETFESVEDCARKGAFCCECIEHGARVPMIR